jgi:hypothetical protein
LLKRIDLEFTKPFSKGGTRGSESIEKWDKFGNLSGWWVNGQADWPIFLDRQQRENLPIRRQQSVASSGFFTPLYFERFSLSDSNAWRRDVTRYSFLLKNIPGYRCLDGLCRRGSTLLQSD